MVPELIVVIPDGHTFGDNMGLHFALQRDLRRGGRDVITIVPDGLDETGNNDRLAVEQVIRDQAPHSQTVGLIGFGENGSRVAAEIASSNPSVTDVVTIGHEPLLSGESRGHANGELGVLSVVSSQEGILRTTITEGRKGTRVRHVLPTEGAPDFLRSALNSDTTRVIVDFMSRERPPQAPVVEKPIR